MQGATMNRHHTMHIHCADIIGHRVAQDSASADRLALAIIAHLPNVPRVVLNLTGIPSFSPVFIRVFWSRLTQNVSVADIKERLHIHTSSHTLREAFAESLHSTARRLTCPHFQAPASSRDSLPQQA